MRTLYESLPIEEAVKIVKDDGYYNVIEKETGHQSLVSGWDIKCFKEDFMSVYIPLPVLSQEEIEAKAEDYAIKDAGFNPKDFRYHDRRIKAAFLEGAKIHAMDDKKAFELIKRIHEWIEFGNHISPELQEEIQLFLKEKKK